MKEIYRLLSISSITTTPYHPQSNGMVERCNGTLKSMLKKVCRERPTDWDRYIPALLFSYRELPNETLGFSPFELLFGHSPRGPLALLADSWTDKDVTPETKNVYHYVHDLHNRILVSCEIAQQNADRKTDKYKDFADRKSKPRMLTAGDKVLVLLTDEHNKLKVLWKGPFVVLEKSSPVNYRIDMDGKSKVFHINMLKQYVERCNVAINQSIPCQSSQSHSNDNRDLSGILPIDSVTFPAPRRTGNQTSKTQDVTPMVIASIGVITESEELGHSPTHSKCEG
jgi:hypothetical protein